MSGVPKTYNGKPLIHAWTYDDQNAAIGAVARYQDTDGKKDVVPFFKPDSTGGFSMGIDLSPRPLFGLYKLANHAKDKAVFIVEGEKCASALQSIGLCAITSLGGSNAAKQANWTPLNSFKKVFILPDKDQAGEHYAQDVYRALSALPLPPEVMLLRLDGLPDGGDIVDWLQDQLTGWNGYTPIDETLHEPLKQRLRDELKKAAPVPDDWAVNDATVSEWEPPSEMTSKKPPVQPLTAELIPEPFRAWLDDVAHRMQTPPDFATVSALVITSSLIGSGCAIRPKQHDNWEVIPNLWGGCVSPPSTLKSPSMNEAIRLLDRVQAEYGERFEQEKIGADFDAMANKAFQDDIKAQLAKVTKNKDGAANGNELQRLRAEYTELTQGTPPEPKARIFKTNEVSIQSMTALQNENPRGVLMFRDELTGLLVKWDKEDGQDERAYFLEGWNGNGSYTDNKIGRGMTHAKNVCISLLGGIQPDKLNRYLYQAMQGNNDGLIQRLQLAVYPDELCNWQLIDTAPNKAEKERAYSIMQALAELDFIGYGAVQGEYDDRPHFHFDDDGQEVFN